MSGVDDLYLAFDTAELALAYFEAGVSATLKADGTPVTAADRAVEQRGPAQSAARFAALPGSWSIIDIMSI